MSDKTLSQQRKGKQKTSNVMGDYRNHEKRFSKKIKWFLYSRGYTVSTGYSLPLLRHTSVRVQCIVVAAFKSRTVFYMSRLGFQKEQKQLRSGWLNRIEILMHQINVAAGNVHTKYRMEWRFSLFLIVFFTLMKICITDRNIGFSY